MKNILYITALLISINSFSQGKIGYTGSIIPTGNYPIVDAHYLKGNVYSVYDTLARNTIPLNFRDTGMLVFTSLNKCVYQLQSGISNTNWILLVTIDSNYVHKIGNEYISGDKLFLGRVIVSTNSNEYASLSTNNQPLSNSRHIIGAFNTVNLNGGAFNQDSLEGAYGTRSSLYLFQTGDQFIKSRDNSGLYGSLNLSAKNSVIKDTMLSGIVAGVFANENATYDNAAALYVASGQGLPYKGDTSSRGFTGNINNYYGLFISQLADSLAHHINNNYAIYQEGANDSVVFNGIIKTKSLVDNGELDIIHIQSDADDTHPARFLTLKNDVGETPNPSAGAMIAGSARGGAVVFENTFGAAGHHSLKLGAIDNNNKFSEYVRMSEGSNYTEAFRPVKYNKTEFPYLFGYDDENMIVDRHYVDSIVNSTGYQWVEAGSNIYYTDGNVGIGTMIPIEKLQVAGNIIAHAPNYSSGGYAYLVLNSTTGRFESISPPDLSLKADYLQGSPSVVTSTNDGVGATGLLDDYASATTGTITITTTSVVGGAGAKTLCSLLFGSAFPNKPHVILSPSNDNAQSIGIYEDRSATAIGGFNVKTVNALTDSTTYVFTYYVSK